MKIIRDNQFNKQEIFKRTNIYVFNRALASYIIKLSDHNYSHKIWFFNIFPVLLITTRN